MCIFSLNFWRPISGSFSTLLFLLFISCIHSTNARRNITIDSNNTLIRYVPSSNWTWIAGSLDAGGGHMLTEDPNAYASINFTFVSYWIMSTLWPYHVATQHTVDNTERILIDLQDHTVPDRGSGGGSKASAIVARYVGSTSKMHTIRVSISPGGRYAVLDRLIFEVEDTPLSAPVKSNSMQIPTKTIISSTIAAKNTSTAIADELSATRRTRNLRIALGISVPLLVLLIILSLYLYSRRRNKQKQATLVGSPSPPMTQSQLKAHSIESEWPNSHPALDKSASSLHFALSDLPHAITTEFGPYVPYIPSPSPPKSPDGPDETGSPRRLPNVRPMSPFDERVVLGSWRGVPTHRPDGRPSHSRPSPGRRCDNYF